MGLGMSAIQGMIGRYCLCLCLLGQVLHAEDSADPEAELRAVLAEEPFNPRRVLDTLIACQGMFDSETDTRGFSVELLGRQADGTELRLIGDVTHGQFRSIEFHNGKMFALRSNESVFTLFDTSPSLEQTGTVEVGWNAYSSEGDETTHTSSRHRIAASMEELLGNSRRWTSVVYDPLSQGIRAINGNGETCVVAMRSPSDTERYGSTIAHVSFWKGTQLVRELRRPMSEAGTAPQTLPEFDIVELDNISATQNRENLEIEIWSHLRRGDASLIGLSEKTLQQIERVLGFIGQSRGKKPGIGPRGTTYEEVTVEFFPKISIALGFVNQKNHISVAGDCARLHSDDAATNWWQTEQLSSPNTANRLVDTLALMLVDRGDLSLDNRAMLADQIGDLGRPSALLAPLPNHPDRRLIEAILFSRWGYPCSQVHIDACARSLIPPETGGLHIHLTCVESLLRMDRLEMVAPGRLERWWTHCVSNKDTRIMKIETSDDKTSAHAAPNEFKRWETICLTSRFPSGRRFLISRLESSDPPVVKRKVWSALQQRAESTMRQQRFDFMSRQECEEILAIPQIPEPGRDSESGAARPFPTGAP